MARTKNYNTMTLIQAYNILVLDIDPKVEMPALSEYIVKHYGLECVQFFFQGLPELILRNNHKTLDTYFTSNKEI